MTAKTPTWRDWLAGQLDEPGDPIGPTLDGQFAAQAIEHIENLERERTRMMTHVEELSGAVRTSRSALDAAGERLDKFIYSRNEQGGQ